MNDDCSIEALYIKVGRNVLLLQQLEHMLKYLVKSGNISGYADELKEKAQQNALLTQKQTMGNLVGRFINTTYSEPESIELEEPLKKIHFSMNFRIEADQSTVEDRARSLAKLVSDRNYLVHHLLEDLDIQPAESRSSLCLWLNQQADNIQGEIDALRGTLSAFQELRQSVNEAFESGLMKELLMQHIVRHDPLTILLVEICSDESRAGGWIPMSRAGQVIRQRNPEALQMAKSKYGCKTLKQFVLASELFDVLDEPTKKGGIRTLFRCASNPSLPSQ